MVQTHSKIYAAIGCRKLCAENDDCFFYTYNKDSDRCFLKRTCDSVDSERNQISGAKLDRTVLPPRPSLPPVDSRSGYDYYDNTECGGSDLQAISRQTVSQCEAICSSNKNCAAFTFRKSDGSCFLKAACPRGSSSTSLSGVRKLRLSLPNYKQEIGCKDETIQTIRDVPMLADCAKECDGFRGCLAFTYNSKSDSCFLKERCDRQSFGENDVSGFLLGPGVSLPTYLKNVGCKDDNVKTIRDTKLNDCAEECRDYRGCVAFTYNSDTVFAPP
mmetsp:Transcript_6281/g.17571  ORF Transcript_6281/g.17571 Transcript_6281/m.17571 type:complete len:273 (+) Transcript_6281:329-1147(+)